MSTSEAPKNPDSPAPTPDPTQENGSATQSKIEALEKQLQEKESRYLYLYAEFENFKKRVQKEREELLKYGWEPAASELVQVLDNLERAVGHLPENCDKNLALGLKLVVDHFRATLKKQGIEEVPSIGKAFDPHLHEAVAQEASSEAAGTVLREELRGYTLSGRLLRAARVVVSSG